jgi:predicted nucleic acid-binding protein
MILVDTSIWSSAFRRPKHETEINREAKILYQLIEKNEPVALPGIVVQELLSGLREDIRFRKLQQIMEGFPVILATVQDHIEAARIGNACRSKGVAASAADCLIVAMTIGRDAVLFTSDQDFKYIATCCPLKLFSNQPSNPDFQD